MNPQPKKMKTKTAKQLFEQWCRIAHLYCESGRQIVGATIVHKASAIQFRYRDNIYKHFGVNPDDDPEDCKRIFESCAVPRSVYAGY